MAIKRKITRTKLKYKEEKLYTKLIPTGCTLLDLALGGGLPLGRVTNIVGDRSAGKTILATEITVNALLDTNLNAEHEYDDAENGYSIPTKRMYGKVIRKEDDYSSATIQDLQARIKYRVGLLENNKILIYILDSVEGLQSDEEIKHTKKLLDAREDNKEVTGSFGTAKAAHMNELLRSQEVKNKNVLTIFVSQTRDKIGVTFGSVKTRHCEKALEFYSNVIIYLRVAHDITKTIDKKEYSVGTLVEAKIKKNKVIGSKFNPLIILKDGLGIDDVDTNICFLWDLIDGRFNIKEQIKVGFDGKGFKSRKNLIQYIEDNNLEDAIKYEVEQKWNDIIEKLSVKNRKRRFK